MNELKILEKVVDKALKNGWQPVRYPYTTWTVDRNSRGRMVIAFINNDLTLVQKNAIQSVMWKDVMFDFDFNKAFWGELCKGTDGQWHEATDPINCMPEYLYRMQEMVIQRYLLDYLKDYV